MTIAYKNLVMSAIGRATRFGSKGVRIAKAPKKTGCLRSEYERNAKRSSDIFREWSCHVSIFLAGAIFFAGAFGVMYLSWFA